MSNKEVVVYTLTTEEVKEQKKVISKYKALLLKEIAMGHLMNLKNIEVYARVLKDAHRLIEDGIIFDDEFMVNQSRQNN